MPNHLPPPHSQVTISHRRVAKGDSESEHEGEHEETPSADAKATEPTNAESAPAKKKKKSKKKKVAEALTGKKDSAPDPPKPLGSKMTPEMLNTLLEMNPS